jgi:hypothetical protein
LSAKVIPLFPPDDRREYPSRFPPSDNPLREPDFLERWMEALQAISRPPGVPVENDD